MPAQVIYRLYDLQNAAVCVCRFAQVHTNWQRGSTGQLSLVTRAAMVFGNCVRIFTTIKNSERAPLSSLSHLPSGFIFLFDGFFGNISRCLFLLFFFSFFF